MAFNTQKDMNNNANDAKKSTQADTDEEYLFKPWGIKKKDTIQLDQTASRICPACTDRYKRRFRLTSKCFRLTGYTSNVSTDLTFHGSDVKLNLKG